MILKLFIKLFISLSNIFGLFKDPIEPVKRCCVVYEVQCADCDKLYVGQTGNSLDTRLNQHKATCHLFQMKKSALAQHMMEEDHNIDWTGAKVIAQETRWRHRLFEEAFHTQARSNRVINRCDEFLPAVFKALF